MKIKKKKILALILLVALLAALIPSQTLVFAGPGKRAQGTEQTSGRSFAMETNAAESTEDPVEPTEDAAESTEDAADAIVTAGAAYVNPIYEDVVSEENLTIPEVSDVIQTPEGSANGGISVASEDESSTASDEEETSYCETVEEAGTLLREGMREREETIIIYYYGETYSSDYFKELCTAYLLPEALAETENADEGDYIRYNYGGTGYRAAITADENGDYRYYTITFTPTYFTTAEQEEEMTEAVDELLASEFAFTADATVYEQLYTVYDYICSHVTYDNDNLSDSSYTLKYTAYAALVNGTAVCQGYATLYYRFLRELDLGVRVATGYGGVVSDDESDYYENHAWNIVQIDGKWYYADSTWDASFSDEVAAGTYTWQYFLKGTADFDTLESPYSTAGIHYLIMDEEFTDTYPIEKTKYVKVIQAPSVTLAATQNNGKIKLTATITGYGDTDNYYEVTGEGFVYITKAKLGAKALSVNTAGRTKVTISSGTMAAKYAYSMTPASASTNYVIRAWITYVNSSGKTVYVYSDAIYTSYNSLES